MTISTFLSVGTVYELRMKRDAGEKWLRENKGHKQYWHVTEIVKLIDVALSKRFDSHGNPVKVRPDVMRIYRKGMYSFDQLNHAEVVEAVTSVLGGTECSFYEYLLLDKLYGKETIDSRG